MKPHFVSGLALGTALILAACGGGGGGGGGSASGIQVSTSVTGNGSLSPGSRSVSPESTTSFSVEPDPGHELASISGCGGSLTGNTFTTGPITTACTVSASFEPQSFAVTTAIEGDGSGSLEPGNQTISFGNTAEITVTPDTDSEIGSVSGCGGSLTGNTYTTAPIEADCTVTASFELITFSVSGRVTPTEQTDFDTTLNDGFTKPVNNNDFANAQELSNNRVTLQGFASAEAVDNPDPDNIPMNFDETEDPFDVYSVYLQKGQVIRLQVVDRDSADPAANDLDLGLYRDDLIPTLESMSNTTEALEELVVPEDGDYFIEVSATSGVSKYVLQLLASGTATATSLRQVIPSNFVPGEMLVKTQSSTPQTLARPSSNRAKLETIPQAGVQTTSSRSSFMASLAQRHPESYHKRMTLEAIKARRKDPEVVYAEPNYLRYPLLEPNDQFFDRQWHYATIDLPQAWDITVGKSGDTPRLVAVVDTGLFLEHPDFEGQLVPGFDFVSNPDNSGDGDGIDSDPSDPGGTDSSWHGTHVAGTVAAATNNGEGVAGVAWGARIMPLRAMGQEGGTTSDILQAALYAARLENASGDLPERAADIINMSLGGPGFSQTEADTYAEIRNAGVILVASAGNDNSSTSTFPAAYEAVFSVGSTDGDGSKSEFSNFGEDISLAAPGGPEVVGLMPEPGILSTFVDDSTEPFEPVFGHLVGTSMAAPHVSGVLALMKDIHPGLTADEVEEALVAGAMTDDLGDPGRDDFFGYGQINAHKAVNAAQQLAAGEPFDLPPQLALNPSRLDLGLDNSALVTLTNEGDGDPQVSTSTNVPWLTVEAENVDAGGLGDYRISVTRTGLADGFYRGEAIFTADTGDEATLRVDMQVGTDLGVAGRMPQIIVILSQPLTDEAPLAVLAETQDDGSATFEFPDVPVGSHRLTAISDIDADRLSGPQAGEFFGIYPSLQQPTRVVITDSDQSGLNFTLDIQGSLSTTEEPSKTEASTLIHLD